MENTYVVYMTETTFQNMVKQFETAQKNRERNRERARNKGVQYTRKIKDFSPIYEIKGVIPAIKQ